MASPCGRDADPSVDEAERQARKASKDHDKIVSLFQKLDSDSTSRIPERLLSELLRRCSSMSEEKICCLLARSGACERGTVDYACFLAWLCREELQTKAEARDAALERQCLRAGMDDLGVRGCAIPKTEERAVTLPQLQALLAHVSRRCPAESWRSSNPRDSSVLHAPDVNLYDVVHYVVKPSTRARRCSYVELVADGPQLPRWFVSHWWGEPVADFVTCLQQHAKDRQLCDTSPYWVCAYANNQWQLGGDLASDPASTSFYKAMQLAVGTVSVLDRQAICYSRAWCGYEVFVSLRLLAQEGFKYDMYTVLQSGNDSVAVGIADGIPEVDRWRYEKYWKENKFTREKHFPTALARGALSFRVQDTEASEELDRTRILNSIALQPDLNSPPPVESAHFEEVNRILRGRFAAATWRIALEQQASMDSYCMALLFSALTDIRMSFDGCELFDDAASELLARALPESLVNLEMDLACRSLSWASGQHLGDSFMRLQHMTQLTLVLSQNSLEAKGVMHLSVGLARLHQLRSLTLVLDRNNIGEEGATHLGEGIGMLCRLSSLTLGLKHNRIPADGARRLGLGLERLQDLESLELSLRDNRLGDEGAGHIGQSIRRLPATLVSLKLLLYGNQLEDDGARYIGEAVETLHQLTSLSLWLNYNYFGDEGERHVRQSVDRLKKLTFLDLDMGQGSGGLVMG